jgi:hypothetical protein
MPEPIIHFSYNSFRGSVDDGKFIMLKTLHITYCKKTVDPSQIDNKMPTCDDCNTLKTWELIDKMARGPENA